MFASYNSIFDTHNEAVENQSMLSKRPFYDIESFNCPKLISFIKNNNVFVPNFTFDN